MEMLFMVLISIIVSSIPVGAMQLCMIPIAYKTAQRKQLNTQLCLWLLVPWLGMLAAYWIACAKEPA